VSHLIDTNGWIAFFEDSKVLSESAAQIMESGAPCFISIASLWEAAIKVGLGKLKLPYDLNRDLPWILEENGFQVLGIEMEDAAAVQHIEPLHGDPFDRIQVAQARRRGLSMISRDPVFQRYGLRRIW
jgi:PIN domain nuclease of toxin-antitoxin system